MIWKSQVTWIQIHLENFDIESKKFVKVQLIWSGNLIVDYVNEWINGEVLEPVWAQTHVLILV